MVIVKVKATIMLKKFKEYYELKNKGKKTYKKKL